MEISNVRSRPISRRSIRHPHGTSQLDETPASAPRCDLRSTLESSAAGFLQSPTYSPLFDISDIIGSSGRPSRLTETPFLRTPLARANETTQDEWLSKLEFFTPDKSGHPLDVSTSQIISENIPPSSLMLLDDDDEDEVAASKSLYVEFLEILLKHPSSEVFELIEEYEAVCSKQLEILKKRTAMSVRIQKKTMSVLWLLNQEMITWRLIRSLYSDRVQSALEDEDALAVDEFVSGPSEKRVMEALFRRDAITRQSQLVVDWLESVAKNEIDNYLGKIRYSCDSVCWENTLHLLNQSKSFGSFLNTRIVTELDPDAPIRQKLHLAEQDREDEANLLKHTFDLIRAGMVDEAQRHCKHCGQAWRAATLEGWRLYHDPNYDGVPSSGELQPIEGNFYRDVWKRCCWRMAEEEQFNRYERAIYATLSGNLKQLLLACVSWEDHLWAYFRVMVDGLVEQEVRSLTIRTRELEDLPQEMTPIELTAEKIFEEIQATNLALLKESKEHFHVLQKHVILGDVDGLMQEFGTWLTQSEVVLPSHLLRCMAHMVLFLRTLGLETKENISLEVLKAYVELLVREKHTGLVAFYARHLPPEHAAVAYAAFLEGITETEERKLCLQLAEQAGLDVMAVTKLVVENIRRADPVGFVHHDSSPILNSATSVDDLSMIDAIEWLIFEPNHRAEAIKQSNAIVRALLASKKHEAAKALFERIPGDSIDVIHRLWEEQSMEVPLPQETDRAIREHLCIHTYLDAHDSFNTWFQHFNQPPGEPSLPAQANYMEQVAHEHLRLQYERDYKAWDSQLRVLSLDVRDKIYNVLLFVDGGWMVDSGKHRPEVEEEKERLQQMEKLRRLCLPSLCFLLHTVLHSTEKFHECLRLADIIASEQYRLYKVFSESELRTLLSKLRESSLRLLDQNLDPLGYECQNRGAS